ncbi:hypothetical protein PPL_04995 [Heterostelium album PN500]|uniref:Uncharacterized protein n=1 Tax=Heterostelium pallidum (strain ATCC 26659 / Pp 5 / PN500) TaxID=670386 RepID=D3B951_HETP5|nr:hypothetical protein PPL_04995 [Heterostelium album PN500]EFA82090.1 hypothetical protein PPL_04995 [Heterostelium album PN500]|eukprot:XP_020434207.1 hypothetical protein PPL_04995 [Heterostelium album PN500]
MLMAHEWDQSFTFLSTSSIADCGFISADRYASLSDDTKDNRPYKIPPDFMVQAVMCISTAMLSCLSCQPSSCPTKQRLQRDQSTTVGHSKERETIGQPRGSPTR